MDERMESLNEIRSLAPRIEHKNTKNTTAPGVLILQRFETSVQDTEKHKKHYGEARRQDGVLLPEDGDGADPD